MKRLMILLPLIVFIGLAVVLAVSVSQPKGTHESPLIDKRMPEFSAPQLGGDRKFITPVRMKGEIVIINFFASWCAPCRAEQAELMALVEKTGVPIYGISYKDSPEATKKFLREAPNPYVAVGMDPAGDIAMRFGVTGVPETFLIARDGKIRYRLSGPLTAAEAKEKLMPLLSKMKGRP